MADTLERTETHRLIASDKVEGTAVYNPQNEKLGTITSVMIEKRSGKSEYAVLEFGGLFGLGSDHYPIPWEMLTYDTDKGGYVVNLTKEQVEGAPRYAREEAPEYTDDYGRTIYGYYGLSYPML
ncbi:PRC-barrel domain-containing protein [Sphingopyxis indica]|uniref:PRC-barrel domain-containing protein n=1 Tax=Sphingopyxis indica TaxID=436663 RepID=A0A239EID2_9SPHN|nr:PRC-barrel domain-containing protein [Sphingopyxis indica]WOF41796.1 PRC-barrel domain-containing protein [Sphingopyxis indica]SNS44319.1 PRC-barrel domain-containing protein [Sphingopyxis indica]